LNVSTEHHAADHEAFIIDRIFPLVVAHARASSAPIEVVLMATPLSLATVMHIKGLSRRTLIQLIDATLLTIHEAPEGLH